MLALHPWGAFPCEATRVRFLAPTQYAQPYPQATACGLDNLLGNTYVKISEWLQVLPLSGVAALQGLLPSLGDVSNIAGVFLFRDLHTSRITPALA